VIQRILIKAESIEETEEESHVEVTYNTLSIFNLRKRLKRDNLEDFN
jgi:hypothetical protein